MKNSVIVLLMLLLGSGLMAQQVRNCGSMENQARLDALDPHFPAIRAQIEAQTEQFVDHYQSNGQDLVVTIPVVVHVVYNTTAQNISDAQIQSQITVLNNDFRKLNADRTLVPSAFSGLAADCEINFCLANRDPNGLTTTGITRTQTTVTAFSTNDAVKRTSSGGRDAWPAASYLNLWVCNLSGGVLGYAQFPGGTAATDGVVITYTGFGTTGTAAAPYNKGRTATHEVGHWLNLRHIWGDANCGSDLVNDTPTSQTSNFGCPAFPHVTCSNGPNGDMFMNYMDYTDDACMYMFTTGQKARMQALFATGGARVGLLSSLGCSGGTTPTCGNATPAAVSGITTTGATLSWSAVSGATSYNIQYKTSSATTYTTTTSTTTSKVLTGLTAGTTYNWQVQAVCASGSGSYVAGANFTTTSGAGGSCDIYEPNGSTTAAYTISANTAINAQIGSSTDNDYYKIVTTSSAPKIKVSLTNLPADFDVVLLNSSGTQLGISQNGSTTSETIIYNTPTTGGTYYVRVYGYNGASSTTVCYNLLVSTNSAGFRQSDILEAPVAKDYSSLTGDVMQVYPNPTAQNLFVSYTAREASNAALMVMDLSGRIVLKRDVNMVAGANQIDLNVGELVDGMYIVRVQTASGTHNAKVQVMH